MDTVYRTIELEIEKLYSQQVVDFKLKPENFNTVYFPELENYLGSGIRMIYKVFSYSDDAAIYPADWWQAFKARWFPGWALSRWPVKWEKVVIQHLFPEGSIAELGKEKLRVSVRPVIDRG